MDYAVQKATELGASSLTPLTSERCVLRLDGDRAVRRLQHWRGVAVHACEQCGRTRVPEINEPDDLLSWAATVGADLKLLLDPTGTTTLVEIDFEGDSIAVLIGPEGGLSEHEIEHATRCGFAAVRLGPRVLRAETATAAALTAVQLMWGDL